MGYDLHITRRRDWSGPGADISQAEWRRLLEAEPDLRTELEWDAGVITAKNPTPAIIDRMVDVARRFDAIVQGDDGERYLSSDASPIPYEPSLSERVKTFLAGFVPRRRVRVPLPPFHVGDPVRDSFGRPATVIAIRPEADHGLGQIVIRYESGREATFAMAAHGLSAADDNRRA